MKHLIIILLFTAICLKANSQVNEEWRRTIYNTETLIRNMHIDNTGNIILTGHTKTTPDQQTDFKVTKFTQAGDTIWSHQYNSVGAYHDFLMDSYLDNSNNLIVTGYSTDLAGGLYAGKRTIKYLANGTVAWTAFDSSVSFIENVATKESYIQTDTDGNIYICSNDYRKLCILKYSPAGILLWKKFIKVPLPSNGDTPRGFYLNSTGMYIITSRLNESFSFDVLALNCTLNGDTAWTKVDTYSNNFWESVRAFKADSLGNTYQLLELMESFTVSKYVLVKLSAGGEQSFTKFYDAGGNQRVIPTDLEIDVNGNIIVSASKSFSTVGSNTYYETIIKKYNITGDSLWTKRFASIPLNHTITNDVTTDANGYIYSCGQYPWQNSSKMFTHKISPSGDSLWHIQFTDNLHWTIGQILKIDNSGNAFAVGRKADGIVFVKYSNVTGIRTVSTNVADKFSLSQNYPNPFNPATNLEFGISNLGFVSLKIYDMLGKEVATLVNNNLSPGTYRYIFDASSLTSGIYFYTLKVNSSGANEFVETKKMLLIK